MLWKDISKILVSIKVIDIKECVEKEIHRDDINFFIEGAIYQMI